MVSFLIHFLKDLGNALSNECKVEVDNNPVDETREEEGKEGVGLKGVLVS